MDSVVHFEIPANDFARAKKFYGTVFGWKMDDVPPSGGMQYSIVQTAAVDKKTMRPIEPGTINGGIGSKGENFETPRIVIAVDDIEKAIAKLTKAGGKKIVDKMPVMDMGWSAYFQDTEGNIVGLWQTKM